MTSEAFNRGERAILEQMAKGHPEEGTLRAQLESARLMSRDKTGVGFYANMEVPREPQHRLSNRRPVESASAHVYGLEYGMTFLLWADDEGYLSSLEGVGFGDGDIDALDFDSVKIEFYRVPEGEFSGFKPPPPSWAA